MQDEPTKSPLPHPGGTPVVAHPAVGLEPHAATGEAAVSPAWANDLRKLYDAVVEEPLPDSLINLLSKLDSKD